ncbi:MAG: integration host factor subunit beta [Proteobacteria bacterium]|nr:integration host factor subunit beta [Pseudomonadota bacterium]
MVKSELAACLAHRSGLTNRSACKVMHIFLDSIVQSLCDGRRVEIRGFGAFDVKTYEPYTGRNPKTGETIKVAAKALPIWKTGQDLKHRVNMNLSEK